MSIPRKPNFGFAQRTLFETRSEKKFSRAFSITLQVWTPAAKPKGLTRRRTDEVMGRYDFIFQRCSQHRKQPTEGQC